jgi:methylthioxylose transferase
VLLGARTARPLLPAVLGALVVVAGFTAAGFWWFDGYHLVVERYYQGIATDRPYGYWWWGNLAATVCAVGLATAAALPRALAPARLRVFEPGSLLVAAGLCAVVAADISGLSKAETERIWLPFDLWLLVATAYLPQVRARPWLAVQAAAALVLVHLLMTNW